MRQPFGSMRKKSERVCRDITKYVWQYREEVSAMRLDRQIWIARRELLKSAVGGLIPLDQKRGHVYFSAASLPRSLSPTQCVQSNAEGCILKFFVGALPRSSETIHINKLFVGAR